MFELIDCRLVTKADFKMKKGYQPKNSLFYILSGKLEYLIEDSRNISGENELVCFPDDVYFERKMLKPMTFYYIRFDRTDNDKLLCGKMNIKNTARLVSTLEYLLDAKLLDRRLKNYYLNDIFVQTEAEKQLDSTPKHEIVTLTEEYFEKNLKEKISLEKVAKEIGISASGLSGNFKKFSGTSPIKYLNEMRIKKAEALLCNTSLSILEISKECGFENAYYFSNTFKKNKGVSPLKYRKSYEL